MALSAAAQAVLEGGADAPQVRVGEQHAPLDDEAGARGQRQHAAEQLRDRPGRPGGADVEDAGACEGRRGILKRLDGTAPG